MGEQQWSVRPLVRRPFLAFLRCLFFGHQLETLRPLSIGGELCQCTTCGTMMAVHHGGGASPCPGTRNFRMRSDDLMRPSDTTRESSSAGENRTITNKYDFGCGALLLVLFLIPHVGPCTDKAAVLLQASPAVNARAQALEKRVEELEKKVNR